MSKVEHVSRGFKEGFKEVSRVFFGYFTCVSRVFHRCFKEISLFLSLFKRYSVFDSPCQRDYKEFLEILSVFQGYFKRVQVFFLPVVANKV